MADQWYYAVNREQKGPVGAAQLLALEQAGVINATTLVWREGLSDWRPWSTLSSDVAASAASAPPAAPGQDGELVVCAYSREAIPRSAAVRYGDAWVAAVHRDAFLQQLETGREIYGVAPGGQTYVGFWWRTLGAVIDWAVKLVPQMLCFVPYWVLSYQTIIESSRAAPGDPFAQFREAGAGALIAYVGGLLGQMAIGIFYDTWMVGKHGGTVGKLALGLRVIRADGGRVSYLHAFGRWAAKLINLVIWWVPGYVAMFAGVMVGVGAAASQNPDAAPVGLLVGMLVFFIWMVIGGIGYYMVGWTKEKTGLHDKICKTRVVRREASHPVA